MEPNRITPQLPPQAMKTYQILAPLTTHHREATCAEVECTAYTNGWKTVVDEGTELGKRQAHYITKQSGRTFTREGSPEGLVTYTFEAGQKCFRPHTVPLDRMPIFTVRGGDWRGNPNGNARTHTRPEDWVDDFASHQQKLADEINKG